ncbi:MAG TPA: hypothetical protein VFI70_06885 [Nitrososphaeraceae archaeon]|nr:hypothetical protein [Nitrososphaeraceae archaeon]
MAILEELKNIAIDIIEKQVDMRYVLSRLDRNQSEKFNNWYQNNEYYNKLQELAEIIKQAKQNSY